MFQVWFNELIFITPGSNNMNHVTWLIWTQSYCDDLTAIENVNAWN